MKLFIVDLVSSFLDWASSLVGFVAMCDEFLASECTILNIYSAFKIKLQTIKTKLFFIFQATK